MGELFCGPGGMALGAHLAAVGLPEVTLVHSWANDLDSDTCSTYRVNIPGATTDSVICQDVRTLELGQLSAIDGLAFGFPCNDFSTVGKSLGLGGRFGPLYTFGVSALRQHNPLWFVAENVSGLQSSNEGKAFEQILRELESAGEWGYSLYPHKYRFDLYGVPQRRSRIIIVGIRKDLNVKFAIPSPEIYKSFDVSVQRALENPPIDKDAPNHEATRHAAHVVERLSHIGPGENAFSADLPEHLKLHVRGATISQIYRRLRAGHPAYTVTGSGGGGTHVYHWEENRALTNRERARLQTFPDTFEFLGAKGSVRRQIGMAVPVSGAQAVFTALFNSFLGVDYPSVEPNLKDLSTLDVRQAEAKIMGTA